MLRLRRAFTTVSLLRQANAPTTSSPKAPVTEVPLDTNIADAPGFREAGEIATNYEIAVGKERYEHLSKLQGKDPWTGVGPIVLTHRGTKENPIKVSGFDPVFYVGCSGMDLVSREY